MRVAVTYENGEVYQHFGHTEQFKIYVTEEKEILSSEIVACSHHEHEHHGDCGHGDGECRHGHCGK